jgi:hypothetical protein
MTTLDPWTFQFVQNDSFSTVRSESQMGSSVSSLIDNAAIWGKGIPTSWGRRKVKGNVLQVGAITQKEYLSYAMRLIDGSRSAAGIGTEFFYYYNLAIALGYPGDLGVATKIVSKIWIDGVLKYDYTKPSLRDPGFVLYPGSALQGVSPLLSIDDPDALAYRGLTYLVLQDLIVEQRVYINPPQVDVEYFDQASVSLPVSSQTVELASSVDHDGAGYDFNNDVVYSLGTISGAYYVFKISASDGVTLGRSLIEDNLGVAAWSDNLIAPYGFYTGPNAGEAYYLGSSGLGNTRPVVLLDAETGQQVATLGGLGIIPDIEADKYGLMDRWDQFNNNNPRKFRAFAFAVCTTLQDHAVLFKVYDNDAPTLERIWYAVSSDYVGALVVPSVTDAQGNTFVFLCRGDIIDKMVIAANDDVTVTTSFATMTYDVIAGLPCSDGNFVVWCQTGGNTEIRKINVQDGSTIWTIGSNPKVPTGVLQTWMRTSFSAGKKVSYLSGAFIVTVDMMSGLLTSISDTSGVTWGSRAPFYDAVTGVLMQLSGTSLTRVTPNVPASSELLLSTFLEELCVVGGFDAADVQVSGITDTITGAYIEPPFDLRNTLNNLAAIYNFEVYESGGKIKIVKRAYGVSESPDFTVFPEDRALLAEGGNETFPSLKTTRISDDKIPNTITLKYIDPDFDYQLTTFTWQRPLGTTGSDSTATYTVPIIMTATKAANLVQAMLYDAWGSRMKKVFRLGQRFLRVDPGDTIRMDNGTYVDFVKVKSLTINGDFSISIEGDTISTDTITIPSFTDDGFNLPPDDGTPGNGRAQVVVIDTPPIQYETINNENLATYLASIPGSRGQLLTAVIEKALAGGAFGQITETIGATFGYVPSALSATDPPNTILDETHTITFRVINGSTDSFVACTELEMLAGTNRLLVGKVGRWEIIGFSTVTVTDNEVELGGLIRGLNGTENSISTHLFADYAILFESNKVLQDVVDVSALNTTSTYRSAGGGYLIANSPKVVYTNVGNWAKPWPAGETVMTDGGSDARVITWYRRSRTEFTLTDGIDEAPLDEDTEEYELEIFDGSGTLVRTVTGLTSPTYSYSSANQVTDGFTPPLASLRVKIYQLGTHVGRGFVKDITLDV